MKKSLIFPVIASLLLGAFMIGPAYGFSAVVNNFASALDYIFSWSISPIDTALVAIIPWIAYRLLQTEEKRSLKNQLGLTSIFLVSALIFFTFGFLLISIDAGDNPLMLEYVKIQPFDSYWSLWFLGSNVLVTVFYYINKRNRAQ